MNAAGRADVASRPTSRSFAVAVWSPRVTGRSMPGWTCRSPGSSVGCSPSFWRRRRSRRIRDSVEASSSGPSRRHRPPADRALGCRGSDDDRWAGRGVFRRPGGRFGRLLGRHRTESRGARSRGIGRRGSGGEPAMTSHEPPRLDQPDARHGMVDVVRGMTVSFGGFGCRSVHR